MKPGTILLFADGASKGNPGPAGWGSVVATPDGNVQELGSGVWEATNNQMELTAVIMGLRYLLQKYPSSPFSASVITDSKYVIQGIDSWLSRWLRNNWKTAEGKDVANQDLWLDLHKLIREIAGHGANLHCHYVPGHQGVAGNERADAIAQSFAAGQTVNLFAGSLSSYPYPLHDLTPKKTTPSPTRTGKNSRSQAFSYLSLVNDKLVKHQTWAECEARVKGVRGAKYRKALSLEDEQQILKEWGIH